ncbi:MAG TPA: hypothetical protein VFF27_13515 [Bacteroidia bacterium]|jgi:undecaprenyl pyrophosphate phosphatase UppP|nr:hypothetical protein [Bacteroidia bacterium]
MKLNSGKPASKSRVRRPIIITGIPTFILSIFVILKFPEFVDRMSRAIENTKLDGELNENGSTSSFELLILMAAIVAVIILWVSLIRSFKTYKRQYLYHDQKLIDRKEYSKLFQTWMNE